MLDVEIAVNNRPLSYVEDDVQLPLLTPNLMMYRQSNILPKTVVADIKDTELHKRAKNLRRCKNVLWSRWTTEYVRELSIVNRNTDMVRKAGKLQRLFARMLIDHISQVTWYAKVHNFQGVTF